MQFNRVEEMNDMKGIEYIKDIEYGHGGGRPLKLDVLYKKQPDMKSMPVVVWIHGGGWRAGNKEADVPKLIRLAQNGYFCASIEYRLSSEAIYPAQIEDCKCAIRFLRANADKFNLDPDRIGVWGSSAGGHLASLLGTTGAYDIYKGSGEWGEYSSNVQAVCTWYGPSDLLQMGGHHNSPQSPESLLIGGSIQENKEKAARANPITYISNKTPPFLIMHGDEDTTVPMQQGQILYEALIKAGVEAEFFVVKGGKHGFDDFPAYDDLFNRTLDFFNRHLK